MEAIGNIVVYLFNDGWLPWMGGEDITDYDDRYDYQNKMRRETTPEELTEGMPPCFCEYIKLVKALDFDKKPNYEKYKTLFDDYYK